MAKIVRRKETFFIVDTMDGKELEFDLLEDAQKALLELNSAPKKKRSRKQKEE